MTLDHQFIGTNTEYPLATGVVQSRIHLDGAASPLVMKTAMDAVNQLLPHYSNSHSHSHASARLMSKAFMWSFDTILKVTGAAEAEESYQCVFMGSGSTALLNNVARRLSHRRAAKNGANDDDQLKDIVLVSALEHHANDLPHRHNATVKHFNVHGENNDQGDIDLAHLESLLKTYQGRINYVAFSAVSNVTGIISPIKEITELAHQYGAYSVVDCAQMAAHMPLKIAENNADFIIFSGHKVYAGASPGVMIAKQALLEQFPSDEMGGGIVDHVGYKDAEFTQAYPARELPGTKNILGAYALAKVLDSLNNTGFNKIQQHSFDIWQYAFDKLSAIETHNSDQPITIYGSSNKNRLGALSFNVKNIDHGLVAAILSDYYGIAVRNECFCAHPYVSSLLKEELWSLDLSQIADEDQEAFINRKRGMLRASFSLYNHRQDVDALVVAIKDIISHINDYSNHYEVLENGDYIHKTFSLDTAEYIF